MTAGTEFSRTDGRGTLPRWLALVLASVATLIAIGALWAMTPRESCVAWYGGVDAILPGPQPCAEGGTVPALVTAGILLVLLAAFFVASFTVRRHLGRVLLIIGAVMLFVLIVGALATVVAANAQPPVIYY
jgi:hypothetical protein